MAQTLLARAPLAVLALGDPSRHDDGLAVRVMGRVRPLIGEILGVRALRRRGAETADAPAPGGASPSLFDHLAPVPALVPAFAETPRPRAPLEWIEAGHRPEGLEPVLGGRHRVVLMDTVQILGKPGYVHHWHLRCGADDRLSLVHHLGGPSRLGLQHLALWLEDELPPGGTDLIGIEPADLSPGEGLSRVIRRSLPTICSEVAAILVRILDEEGW